MPQWTGEKKPHPYRMRLFPLTVVPFPTVLHPGVAKKNTGLTDVNRKNVRSGSFPTRKMPQIQGHRLQTSSR